MGKIVGGVLAALALVVVIVVVFVVQNLDSIIEGVIEDTGSRLTGTPVRVSSVRFDLGKGRGEILGLNIGNPPGYSAAHVASIAKVVVEIAPASVTGPVIHIREVSVDGAEVNAEQRGTRTNLQDLLDNMKRGGDEPTEPAADGGEVLLAMDRFRFTDGRALVITEQWGEKELKLPRVAVDNVGSPQQGVTPAELGEAITTAVVRSAEQAVGEYVGELAKEAAKKELGKQADKKFGEGTMDGVKKLFKKD